MREEQEMAIEAQESVFARAVTIYRQRRRIRGDAWKQHPVGDTLHHIESKLTRVRAIAEKLAEESAKPIGEQDEAFMEELRIEGIDDALDLINYGGFLVRRWLPRWGEK